MGHDWVRAGVRVTVVALVRGRRRHGSTAPPCECPNESSLRLVPVVPVACAVVAGCIGFRAVVVRVAVVEVVVLARGVG